MSSIWASITSIIAVLKGLLELWRYFKQVQEMARVKEAEKKKVELEKALNDLQNAKTEEEIWDAQSRIVKLRGK